MSSRSFSFYFMPGWAENRWKTHLLTEGLIKAGGQGSSSPDQAEVVITHSAGAHFGHKPASISLLVIIGPIYGKGKPIVVRTAQEWFFDNLYYFRHLLIWPWLSKNLYYIYFAIFHPRRTWRTYSSIRRPLNLSSLTEYKVLLIRNRRDHFCLPQIADDARKFKNITFIEVPGRHDDIWTNPSPYVDLVLKHL